MKKIVNTKSPSIEIDIDEFKELIAENDCDSPIVIFKDPIGRTGILHKRYDTSKYFFIAINSGSLINGWGPFSDDELIEFIKRNCNYGSNNSCFLVFDGKKDFGQWLVNTF